MNKIIILLVALMPIRLLADGQIPQKSSKEIMASIAMKRYGGKIRQPNTEKGSIVFVNTQKTVTKSVLERVVEKLEQRFRFTTIISESDVESRAERFVVRLEDLDRKDCIILAPESFWISVNVKALAADNPPKAILVDRFEKEVRRAFAFVCGGTCGTETGGICRMVSSISDLDAIPGLDFSLDVEARIINNMNDSGVRPYRMAKYSEACQEGWAPPPTNDYQRMIWERVHQIPDKSVTIEYDPKRGM